MSNRSIRSRGWARLRGRCALWLAPVLLLCLGSLVSAAEPITLTVNADQAGPRFDPIFYGLMTEEINFSYDGGLYAEVIRNRIFQDRPIPRGGRGRGGGGGGGGAAATQPAADNTGGNPAVAKNPNLVNWWLVTSDGAQGEIDIDTDNPVNTHALTNSLKLDIRQVSAGGRVGMANEGFWGIPVKPNWTYTGSFYARGSSGFTGPLTVAIEGSDGRTVYAKTTVSGIGTEWKKHPITLKTESGVQPTADARFVISATNPGTVWFSLVSLFQPTYKNRANGMRQDIMQLLAEMNPKFLRFPGGNYLEGSNFENRFNWKEMIGPLEDRPGHMSPWRYRSSDGVGLLEFLTWCEDLNVEPIVGVYSGLHLDGGRTVITGEALKPFVQEALEEIEYITGGPDTKWGALRAQHGHPEPFKLRYVQIGNEEFLNNGGETYKERFTMFYNAIKEKYPNIKVISSMQSRNNYDHGVTPDLLDDHDYMTIPRALENSKRYDTYDRNGVKIFAGEWATNNPRQGNTPMMAFALADAVWLTGLERNCDVIVMHCYAPLLVNVNPGGQQWAVNLIGYDAIRAYGSPAYFVQKMFSHNRGDAVVPAKFDSVPKMTIEQLALPQGGGRGGGGGGGRGRGGGGAGGAAAGGPPTTGPAAAGRGGGGGGGRGNQQQGPFEVAYVNATREDGSGDIILKLVNLQAEAQPVNVKLVGVQNVNPQASGEVIASDDVRAVNSVEEPMKVAPKPFTINNAAAQFTHELPPRSVSVLRLKTR